METNALEQIKTAEDKAKKNIEAATKDVESLIVSLEQKSLEAIGLAETAVAPQIDKIIEQAKKEIQEIKAKQDQELKIELEKVGSIEKKKIQAAAEVVVKYLNQ